VEVDLGLFVVNPSIRVSPYCYSIFRVESYSSCEYECVYCFGRWYRKGEQGERWHDVLWSFKRLLRLLKNANLKSIPFRLSTLVDPFQPREEKLRISMKIMKLCLKYDVPLIINTKSTMLLSSEYLAILRCLNAEGLVIAQISISTASRGLAQSLEPKAPAPEARFDVARKLSEEGIPVVIRFQPFIPGISDHEIEGIIEKAYSSGVKHVIVESLRDEAERLGFYRGLAYDQTIYEHMNEWEPYSSAEEPRVLRPSEQWRRSVYLRVKKFCDKYGIKFATCKEGLYDYHTADDCCGMYMLNGEKYVLRPTLFEAWKYYKRRGYVPKFDELVKELPNTYLSGDAVGRYPKPLRKKMASHEKILIKVLNERVVNLNPVNCYDPTLNDLSLHNNLKL